MKYAIPNPTYPPITNPLGTSSLFQFPILKTQLNIGVCPNSPNMKNLIQDALNSTILKVTVSILKTFINLNFFFKNTTFDIYYFENEAQLESFDANQTALDFGVIFSEDPAEKVNY